MTDKVLPDQQNAQDIIDCIQYAIKLHELKQLPLPKTGVFYKEEVSTIYQILDANNDFILDKQDAQLMPDGFTDITNILARHGVPLSLLQPVNIDQMIKDIEQTSLPETWDNKHRAIVQPLSPDTIKGIMKADYLAYKTKHGYDLDGVVLPDGKHQIENHSGGILYSLLQHSPNALETRIQIQLLDGDDNIIAGSKKTVRLAEVLKGEYNGVTYPKTEHNLPTATARSLDAYQILKCMMEYIPVDLWNKKDRHRDETQLSKWHLASLHQIMQTVIDYFFTMTDTECIHFYDHSVSHLPELLVTYYSKTNNPARLQDVKDKFLTRDLTQTTKAADFMILSVAGHHTESLGVLLSNDAIIWSETDSQIVKDWLVKLGAILKKTPPKPDDSEISHLLKGLKDIQRHKNKIGLE